MKRWGISSLQAGMLVAGATSLTSHALAVTFFIRVGGRDAWMTGLTALPLAALAVWSFVRLGRMFPGKTLVEYLPRVLGPLGYPLAALYIVYYVTVVIFTLRMTTDWMIDTILPETPSWVMGFIYTATVLYTAAGGLDVLARVNQFTLPLLTVLGMFVSAATYPAKDYRLLMPFLENGPGPVLTATLLVLGYFGETSILAMFHAYVHPGQRRYTLRAYILALVYEVVTLTGPVAGSIATLGYRVALNMPYPTFQHWLMVSVARFFERTDLLAVHQWLVGAYVRMGLYLLLAARGALQLTGSRGKVNWVLAAAGLLAVAGAELLFPGKRVFDAFVQYVYLPAGGMLGIFIPPLLFAIASVRGFGRAAPGVPARDA